VSILSNCDSNQLAVAPGHYVVYGGVEWLPPLRICKEPEIALGFANIPRVEDHAFMAEGLELEPIDAREFGCLIVP
jgi:hypothetical protein